MLDDVNLANHQLCDIIIHHVLNCLQELGQGCPAVLTPWSIQLKQTNKSKLEECEHSGGGASTDDRYIDREI